jgi:hypothetical protein
MGHCGPTGDLKHHPSKGISNIIRAKVVGGRRARARAQCSWPW